MWNPIDDPADRYSTGIPDFDRLMEGGYRRGSFALFVADPLVGTEEINLLFSPVWLNFLQHSRGILAVLPARENPRGFREQLLRAVTRRRFDARVRLVDYIGEADPAPYVVPLREASRARPSSKGRTSAMAKMVAAERAVSGARRRPFLEFLALEVTDTLFGAETAKRMFFHGAKRTRAVGNLGIALGRPGLGCLNAARDLVDYEFELRVTPVGVEIRGLRPAFSPHVVVPDRGRAPPHVALVPPPAG